MLHEVEGPEFQNERHMKVVKLSALDTGHHYPQEILLIVLSVRELVDTRATAWPGGPFGLQHSSSTNCSTAYPDIAAWWMINV